METVLRLILHASLFVMYAYSLATSLEIVRDKPSDTVFTYKGYAGKFKYLTFWNFVSNRPTRFKDNSHRHVNVSYLTFHLNSQFACHCGMDHIRSKVLSPDYWLVV